MEMIDNPKIRKYVEDHSSPVDCQLLEIERSTFFNTVKPFDASDHIQGRLLSMIANMIKPNVIVEIGTFTGYGTLCLAEGLKKGGKVITIEHDGHRIDLIKAHLKNIDIDIEVINDKALSVLPQLDSDIDMVFIDAAKREYQDYYDLLIPKLRSGGVMLVDNILWKGEVIRSKGSKIAKALDGFNKKVSKDDRVEVVILPYRDGLSIIRKK